jgi:hypothetical protein
MLQDRLTVLLLKEGPFPPHPGSRVSCHWPPQHIEMVERPKKALNLLSAATSLTIATPKPHHRHCHHTDSPLSPQPKAAPPRRRTTQCAIVARPKPEFSPGKKRKGGGLPHQPFKKENGDRIVAADVAGTEPAKSFPRQLPTKLARMQNGQSEDQPCRIWRRETGKWRRQRTDEERAGARPRRTQPPTDSSPSTRPRRSASTRERHPPSGRRRHPPSRAAAPASKLRPPQIRGSPEDHIARDPPP